MPPSPPIPARDIFRVRGGGGGAGGGEYRVVRVVALALPAITGEEFCFSKIVIKVV